MTSNMVQWYYYDHNGRKQGPVVPRRILELAKNGKITPETIIETEDGKSAPAGTIKGLVFTDSELPRFAATEQKPATASMPTEQNPFFPSVPKARWQFLGKLSSMTGSLIRTLVSLFGSMWALVKFLVVCGIVVGVLLWLYYSGFGSKLLPFIELLKNSS